MAFLKNKQTEGKRTNPGRPTQGKPRCQRERKNAMEERLNDSRTLDELREQETEHKVQNKEDQAVKQDENTSPFDKQAAEGSVAESTEELGRLQKQIPKRERVLPLRDRIKKIFKNMA